MKLQNPYTRGYIEYPLSFKPSRLEYQITHETPFTERRSEWYVALITTGDMVYIPCGQNRCQNIYIVTKYYRAKQLTYPHGIYTLPLWHFTQPVVGDTPEDEDVFIIDDDDFDYDDFFNTHNI